jgi:hypothetical protein
MKSINSPKSHSDGIYTFPNKKDKIRTIEIYLPQSLMKKIIIVTLSLFFLFPGLTLAHEPRITQTNETRVLDPEISKAYYSELRGSPQTYLIDSDIPFSLYVNILVPDILDQKKDILVQIIKN